ncbi:hypothetical protein CISG_00600 [Coccidioides immitis RMSCC 3703]|uniref:Uncharacterized protein n=1 Tax=Coccidioides immitis RMSCC 3703 TaxID=454286 RepID=A0A0J8QRF3_COCIT|nr:hypothetical protein CISG_00600 [Coccidioides immitis RMSCC 3703]
MVLQRLRSRSAKTNTITTLLATAEAASWDFTSLPYVADMAKLSPDENAIIRKHPLAKSLDDLHGLLQEAERTYELCFISYHDAVDSFDQLFQDATSKLLYVLLGEEAALNIRSRISDGNVASDLANLFTSLQRGNFSYNHYRRLVRLVIQKPPSTESQNVETWNFDVWNAVLDLINTASRGTPPPRPHIIDPTDALDAQH